ncbi:PREDICTED: uncharacterized protein LOC107356562 [Acropora digitifera]|uniref:uncharacterized protein LOC107356562 n=1 Tax=Acropora digitifera TaxID=70779 RepID=UPI00077A8AF7|nr:PREDICTED: uncharacterized protein LOC107356562 [Acropora digitifera]
MEATLDEISSKNTATGSKKSETLKDELESGISNEESEERQERVVPPAVAEVGTEIVTDLVKQAVDKQIKIMEEQQQKAQELIGKRLELNIEPEKGWKTESMYSPAGVHVDAEYTSENKDEEDFTGEQPFAYPMGVGGVRMNGCYGTNY